MVTLLSNLVDNLTERIHKIKSKDCDCYLQYERAKDNSSKYKCLSCNNFYSSKINEKNSKLNLGTHLSFVIMISMELFSC